MSTPGAEPPSSRRAEPRRRLRARAACAAWPAWTMRKTPPSRAGGGPSKSAGSKPFGIATTGRSASSGNARRRARRPPRACSSRSPPRSRASGACVSSSRRRWSRSGRRATRRAPTGRADRRPTACPSRCELRRGTAGLERRHRRVDDVGLGNEIAPAATAPSTHQRENVLLDARASAPQRQRQPIVRAGSGPGTRTTSTSSPADRRACGRPRAPLHAVAGGAGDDERLVAVLGQVARERERALDAPAAERGKVVREEEHPSRSAVCRHIAHSPSFDRRNTGCPIALAYRPVSERRRRACL